MYSLLGPIPNGADPMAEWCCCLSGGAISLQVTVPYPRQVQGSIESLAEPPCAERNVHSLSVGGRLLVVVVSAELQYVLHIGLDS